MYIIFIKIIVSSSEGMYEKPLVDFIGIGAPCQVPLWLKQA